MQWWSLAKYPNIVENSVPIYHFSTATSFFCRPSACHWMSHCFWVVFPSSFMCRIECASQLFSSNDVGYLQQNIAWTVGGNHLHVILPCHRYFIILDVFVNVFSAMGRNPYAYDSLCSSLMWTSELSCSAKCSHVYRLSLNAYHLLEARWWCIVIRPLLFLARAPIVKTVWWVFLSPCVRYLCIRFEEKRQSF